MQTGGRVGVISSPAQVLPYSFAGSDGRSGEQVAQFSPFFPAIWDRILEYMRYEDKIDNHLMGDLSFKSGESGHQVYWKQLRQPLAKRRREAVTPVADPPVVTEEADFMSGSYAATTVREKAPPRPRRKVKVPDIFREKTAFEVGFKTYCCMHDPHWPNNPDVQWRILALSRGLGLPVPRPFRAPYFPGLTVCIPHYGESILMLKKELFQGREETVPLMDWSFVSTRIMLVFVSISRPSLCRLLKKQQASSKVRGRVSDVLKQDAGRFWVGGDGPPSQFSFTTAAPLMGQVKWGESGWPVAGSQWEELRGSRLKAHCY